jgi:hypothetical protein
MDRVVAHQDYSDGWTTTISAWNVGKEDLKRYRRPPKLANSRTMSNLKLYPRCRRLPPSSSAAKLIPATVIVAARCQDCDSRRSSTAHTETAPHAVDINNSLATTDPYSARVDTSSVGCGRETPFPSPIAGLGQHGLHHSCLPQLRGSSTSGSRACQWPLCHLFPSHLGAPSRRYALRPLY